MALKVAKAWSRGRLIRVGVAVILLAAGALVFRRPLFQENFGVVEPGRVYRCAQPKSDLAGLFDAYRPASILNLRGGSARDGWYSAEVAATRERDIAFYDLPLSATRRPSRRELLTLIDLFGRCRYPLLIHCKSGSDRTGLASGLYLMVVRGESPERALEAFSMAYGHFPIGGPEHLHEPIREYAAWLETQGVAHTPERLRSWVEHDYRADDPPGDLPELRPGSRWETAQTDSGSTKKAEDRTSRR